MAGLKNLGTVIAIDEEVSIGAGQGGAWVAGDVVSFNDDSGLTPAVTTLERAVFNGSYVGCQALSGESSTSGNLNVDLALAPISSTEAGKFVGHLVFKSGFGKYIEQAADVDEVAFTIGIEPDSIASPTGFDLYTLSDPTDAQTTLVVREFLGGSGDAVLDHKGVVVDSMSFDFSVGSIVKVSNSVSGVNFATATGQTVLPSGGCGNALPFVTKNAVLKLDGATLDASNVSMTITNTIVDRKYITGNGTSSKVVTAKSIELSYTVDLDATQMAFYNKMQSNATGAIFLKLVNSAGDKCCIYLPKINFGNVTKSNDSGILTVSVTSMAYESSTGDAILVGTKKA